MKKSLGNTVRFAVTCLAILGLLFSSIIFPSVASAFSKGGHSDASSSCSLAMVVHLSVSGSTKVGDQFELTCSVWTGIPAPDTSMSISIPEEIELIEGDLSWKGSIGPLETVKISVLARIMTDGVYNVTAAAQSHATSEIVPQGLYGFDTLILETTSPLPRDEESKTTVLITSSSVPEAVLQSPSATTGSITVVGYLYYYDQNSGLYRPVRYARAWLYDSDTWPDTDDLLDGPHTTSDTGYFSFGPVDNYEGVLTGTQDIYVKIESYTDACDVQDSGGTTRYAVTPTISNVPDGTYDYGYQEVATAQRGFWNIYDQILVGYQWVDNRPSTNAPPRVAVKWASGSSDGTYFGNPDLGLDGKIHIRGDSSSANLAPDEWDNGVILHEYGHFIAETTWTGKSYDCDNSPGGTHNWLTRISEAFAWSEGWAHYFSSAVRNSQRQRNNAANGDYLDPDLETGVCDQYVGGTHSYLNGNSLGSDSEASVAGVLWDISDSSNDDQNGDGISDTLSQTADMVWYVVRNYQTGGHGVYTINEFWNGWFSYYGYQSEMWALYYEHGINKDTTPPTLPSSFICDHTENVWSKISAINIDWSGESDDLSGVKGYSVLWANSPTLPPQSITHTTNHDYRSLADGVWYFNVRTVDRANNWNPSYGWVGPFKIDTAAPSNPTGHSSSHTVNVWSTDNTVDISWSGASDSGSGVSAYSFVWDQGPSSIPDTNPEPGGTSTTSPALADGNNWYFHVRAGDAAGNWASGAYHAGPFKIDTSPPTSPSCVCDPPANIWTSDNTVSCSLSGASDGSGSGVAGYSFVWDRSPSTIPDTIVDTIDPIIPSPTLSDGIWYLHVRAIDYVGLASSTVHCGPFMMDITSPSNPTGYSSSHTVNVWSTDNTVDISWSGASDGSGSGVSGYSFEWSQSSSTVPDTTQETTGTSTTSSVLADGSSWYFHVRTKDTAGNWAGNAYHVGPFKIDAAAPSTPSPDDGVSGPSSDNTPTFAWAPCTDTSSGVKGYWWKIDSESEIWTTLTSVEVPVQSDGPHTFYVRAEDNAGNKGDWGQHDFQIATSVPASPVISSLTHPDQNVWYSNNDPSFQWTTPSDPSGIAGYSYLLDQSPLTDPVETVGTTGNTMSYTDVGDGVWYFHVRAKNNLGNWGPTAHYRVRADTTAPSTPVPDDGVTGPNSDNTPTFTWPASSDSLSGVKGYWWKVDSGSEAWTTLTSVKLSPQSDGSHTFYVRAEDNAGNKGNYGQHDFQIVISTQKSYLVVRGNDNRIYYRVYDGLSWTGWTPLPGTTSDIPAAAVCNNELHIVVLGTDGRLYHGYVDLSTSLFIGWAILDGLTPSAPTLTTNGTTVCLVVRGGDNRIYYRFYGFSPRGWGSWKVVSDGVTCDTPAAAMLDNDLHIFVRGFSSTNAYVNDTLYYNVISPTGEAGWKMIDGLTSSRPVLAAETILTRLYLVVRGTDDRIYWRARIADSWGTWNLVDGLTKAGPGATVVGWKLCLVVLGLDDRLYHGNIDVWSSVFNGWTMPDGLTPSEPTLAS